MLDALTRPTDESDSAVTTGAEAADAALDASGSDDSRGDCAASISDELPEVIGFDTVAFCTGENSGSSSVGAVGVAAV